LPALSGNLEELAQLVSIGLDTDKPPTADETAKIRAWLAANPDEFRHVGEMAKYALERVVDTGTTWAVERESVRLRIEELKTSLGYEGSNHIERMMIEQVVLCWARLYFLEQDLANSTKGNHQRETGIYWDRRVTSAQHRYNQALISLAKVRKLKLPDITAIQAQVAYVNAGDGPLEMRAQKVLTP
jgi:hypothetical protein